MNLGRFITTIVLTSLGALAARPARACSVCGCGDPLLTANDPAAINGRMRLEIDAEYLTVQSGSEMNPAATDKLDQYTLRLNGVYSPVVGLSVIAQVPFTRKNLAMDGITGSDISGIGDVELGARYTLVDVTEFSNRRRQALAISAGTSFPTGSNDAIVNGERVDEHGQLGTGAWGPYAGVHYHFEQDRWTAFASVSGRVRTTNSFNYRYGSALLWSVSGQYWPLTRLAITLGIDGRYAGRDQDDSGSVDNTGGTLLAAAPALHWNVSGPFWFALRAQLPFYSNLYGRQSVGPTVVTGLQYQVL